MHPRLLWVTADVGLCSLEDLAVDVDPRVPHRTRRLARGVRAVVDAAEIDRLGLLPTQSCGGGRPTIAAKVARASMCDIISPYCMAD
jgi:hypothetical protein